MDVGYILKWIELAHGQLSNYLRLEENCPM
jgi:hypothetical protein